MAWVKTKSFLALLSYVVSILLRSSLIRLREWWYLWHMLFWCCCM